jgi:hypothetical protein
MFWSKKKKPAKVNNPAQKSADIRAQALANARAARERVGEETIQKIAAALLQQQERQKISLTEQAKAQIARANSERVVDEIRLLMDDSGNTTRH